MSKSKPETNSLHLCNVKRLLRWNENRKPMHAGPDLCKKCKCKQKSENDYLLVISGGSECARLYHSMIEVELASGTIKPGVSSPGPVVLAGRECGGGTDRAVTTERKEGGGGQPGSTHTVCGAQTRSGPHGSSGRRHTTTDRQTDREGERGERDGEPSASYERAPPAPGTDRQTYRPRGTDRGGRGRQ